MLRDGELHHLHFEDVPASLELFQNAHPRIQTMEPYQLAMRARATIEPLIA
jgi:hypothetical protein